MLKAVDMLIEIAKLYQDDKLQRDHLYAKRDELMKLAGIDFKAKTKKGSKASSMLKRPSASHSPLPASPVLKRPGASLSSQPKKKVFEAPDPPLSMLEAAGDFLRSRD